LRSTTLALIAGWLMAWASMAQEFQPVPALNTRVTDLTGTLSAADSARIEANLAAFENAKGAQVAVLIVGTTQPEEIEQYGIRVVEQWKLGRGKVDDGALLLVAKDDRRLRIEVGYGLEGVLTDANSRRIIDEIITPRFRAGDFAGGIEQGTQQMMKLIDGEAPPPPARQRGLTDLGGLENWLMPLLIVVVAGGALLRAILGPMMGALVTGGLVGVAVWFIAGVALVAGIAGVVAFIFTLAGMSRALRGGWSNGSSGGGWSSGGGGFRGGGGGFGGGGASGRW